MFTEEYQVRLVSNENGENPSLGYQTISTDRHLNLVWRLLSIERYFTQACSSNNNNNNNNNNSITVIIMSRARDAISF